jgi:hypothetical protein
MGLAPLEKFPPLPQTVLAGPFYESPRSVGMGDVVYVRGEGRGVSD